MRGNGLMRRSLLAVVAVMAAGVLATGAAGGAPESTTVVEGLDNPRGLAFGERGRLLVAESLTGVTEVELKRHEADVEAIASLPGVVDVAVRRNGRIYAVVAADAPPGGPVKPATLVRIRPNGEIVVVADIGAYQQTDPDRADLEDNPTESNPNGLALLPDRKILVADAAGNDVLLVDERFGRITTVARLLPEEVPWPEGDPPFPAPPPGTPTPAEAVATSVTVGPDGAYYVTELKGFPFSPGTSRIWRIKPDVIEATCDPENDDQGACRTVATGFSSLIDLAFGRHGTMYPLEIAKESLWAVEILGAPPVGALYEVDEDGDKEELAPGSLLFPGGVAVRRGEIFVTTGAVFGPDGGAVVRIDD
jgi:sugar lactone lactonase YvrE